MLKSMAKAELNVTIDLDTVSPTREADEADPEPSAAVSSSTSSLSSAGETAALPLPLPTNRVRTITTTTTIMSQNEAVVDPVVFDAGSVPKTFDMFLNDIRKSSSTLDIHTAVNADTSSDEPALNRTFKVSGAAPTTLVDNRAHELNRTREIITSSIDKDLNIISASSGTLSLFKPHLYSNFYRFNI